MGKRIAEVDRYIENAPAFAPPILNHLRALLHEGCPDVEETIKWGMPCFERKGILCNMAAFKNHCSFGFWKASLLTNNEAFESTTDTGLGHLGKIREIKDLPTNESLLAWIGQAVILNEKDIKPEKSKNSKIPLHVPEDFAAALKDSKTADEHFKSFAEGYRRDYIEWISSAKTDKTRQKRLATAIEWIAEGKHRNWKYEGKC